MDAKQAERRFKELEKLRRSGTLGDDAFRVEVAKLLWRDTHGVFWMIDPETGEWLSNRGEGWLPGDPHQLSATTAPPLPPLRRRPRRWRQLLAILTILAVLVFAGGILFYGPEFTFRNPLLPPPTEPSTIQVTIASPEDGSRVAPGQVVAIETTVEGHPDLRGVTRVEARVGDEIVAVEPVAARIQPGQASLPLSLPWRPSSVGDYQLTVTAYSANEQPLGMASISLGVDETPDEVLPASACTPGAVFVADVTIPPDTAFPPGARMDKVWQVRNNGSCAWGVGYELVLVEGEDLGAPPAIPVPATAAGEMADLAITLWAPAETGGYESVWQLQAPDGQFFGPTLVLSISVQVLAVENVAPAAPANLQAEVLPDGQAVRLTWEDRSETEDAFRIYREDVAASIGLAQAGAEQFVDENVACGHLYRYTVVAFNAAGVSPVSNRANVSLPACAPAAQAPPLLILTIVPTRVVATRPFTVVFQAEDDLRLTQVSILGLDTGDPEIDAGRVFSCTEPVCTGSWPLIWTADVSTTLPLTLTATARDSSGLQSEPARVRVLIRPPE
jgi:hypothetical protein